MSNNGIQFKYFCWLHWRFLVVFLFVLSALRGEGQNLSDQESLDFSRSQQYLLLYGLEASKVHEQPRPLYVLSCLNSKKSKFKINNNKQTLIHSQGNRLCSGTTVFFAEANNVLSHLLILRCCLPDPELCIDSRYLKLTKSQFFKF